jgi:hypothetical protein
MNQILNKESLDHITTEVFDKLEDRRDRAKKKFPLGFGLLALFGFSFVLQGVNGLIDKFDYLSRNPVISLTAGVLVLFLTGTLYKKLGVSLSGDAISDKK